jgi:phosphate:Na+ symporter
MVLGARTPFFVLLIALVACPAYCQESGLVVLPYYDQGIDVSGNEQVGEVGQRLDRMLRVVVLDSEGNPVPGVDVHFFIEGHPPSDIPPKLDRSVAKTDGIGRAGVSLTLSDAPGLHQVRAEIGAGENQSFTFGVQAYSRRWETVLFMGLLGGLCLFLYGMRLSARGLRKIAGNRLRGLLSALTANRVVGVLVGAVTSAIIQSSSATTVLVVGLVSGTLMTMTQAIGVILGANIGTTVTVQLIAFKITEYALIMVAAGFIVNVAAKRDRTRNIGEFILGFGFIFFGMDIMSNALEPLKDHPGLKMALSAVDGRPFLGLALSAFLTAVIQSSGATIGLALILARQGLIGLEGAIPIVLGANVGTTVTALLASIGTSTDGKRAALSHLLVNVGGAVIFFPLIKPFAAGIREITALVTGDIGRQIANAHMSFNILIAVIYLPFVGLIARFVYRFGPAKDAVKKFGPIYLDKRALDTPPLALAQATREIQRMANITFDMLRDSILVFRNNDQELRHRIIAKDDKVDILEESITPYLTELSTTELTDKQSGREVGLLYIVNDLEHIGDIVSKSLMAYARKKIEDELYFSDQGYEEIVEYHAEVLENFRTVISSLATWDRDLARRAVEIGGKLKQRERELHRSHIDRLHKGLVETLETSTVHLDLINDLNLINSHITEIAAAVLGEI